MDLDNGGRLLQLDSCFFLLNNDFGLRNEKNLVGLI